jgi:hypothetical protein
MAAAFRTVFRQRHRSRGQLEIYIDDTPRTPIIQVILQSPMAFFLAKTGCDQLRFFGTAILQAL